MLSIPSISTTEATTLIKGLCLGVRVGTCGSLVNTLRPDIGSRLWSGGTSESLISSYSTLRSPCTSWIAKKQFNAVNILSQINYNLPPSPPPLKLLPPLLPKPFPPPELPPARVNSPFLQVMIFSHWISLFTHLLQLHRIYCRHDERIHHGGHTEEQRQPMPQHLTRQPRTIALQVCIYWRSLEDYHGMHPKLPIYTRSFTTTEGVTCACCGNKNLFNL